MAARFDQRAATFFAGFRIAMDLKATAGDVATKQVTLEMTKIASACGLVETKLWPHLVFARVCFERLNHRQYIPVSVFVPRGLLKPLVKMLTGAVG